MKKDEPSIDFKKLTDEAKQEAYDPRAKKCWPWSHQWTMWKIGIHPSFSALKGQTRNCIRCGKTQAKLFRLY